MNILSRQKYQVTPRVEDRVYQPVFLRAIKNHGYYYIHPESLQEEKISCWKKQRIDFSEWLSNNNLDITKQPCKNDLYKIFVK